MDGGRWRVPCDPFLPPLALTAEQWSDRDTLLYRAIGRLAPGVTLAGARRDLERISRQLATEHPTVNRDWRAGCRRLLDDRVGHLRPALYLLLAAAGLVLAVACVNVIHLVLARGAARRREIGVRVALGARRGHLLRQTLTESAVLALSGGAAGIALAAAVIRAVVAWNPGSIPRLDEIRLDAGTIGLAIAVTAASAMLFALVPVLRAGGANVLRTAAEGSRATADTGRRRLHQLLVALESAMVMMLLTAALQMIRSLDRLMQVDVGFETAGRIAFEVTLPESKYARWLDNARVVEQVSERLEALPGVEAAGAGIVRDYRNEELGLAPRPEVYLANLQLYDSWTSRRFVVWLKGDPFAHLAVIRQAVWSVDPDLPISDVKTLATVVTGAAAEPRFRARLLTVFAAVALVLGGLGIYGVISYITARRRREMAIRLAVGGIPMDVLWLVLASGLRPVLAGVVAGIAGSVALARVVTGMLFKVSPTDPAALLAIALFLTVVAALGTLLPALDAARRDPAKTLRCDG